MSNSVMDIEDSSLCRICLEEGASYPIFEPNGKPGSIALKLSECLNDKVEDLEGYPKSVCKICLVTLETVCSFIQKYKDSCKILESRLLVVKDEKIDFNQYSDADPCPEVEIEINGIKEEPEDYIDLDNDDGLVEYVEPTQLKKRKFNVKKELTKITKNKEITIRRINSESKNKTNKIAASLLEGDFSWTGDKWCLMKSKTKELTKAREPKEPKQIIVKNSRQLQLKIPKIKGSPAPKLCDICGDVFKTQEKLSLHKKKVHNSSPRKCPECPRICSTEYYLNKHIRRKHENIRNFICATCGKGFTFKGELTAHNRKVHEKHLQPKKVFACKICDKKYKCNKSVVVHERAAHSGDRPAECDICGSRFYHVDYLREHMRLHTGETPFKCPICGRGYAQRGNMKSHLRIHRLSEISPEILSNIRPNYLKLLKDFR